jgi:NADH-quinone oxidoreductase subunit N
VNPALASLPSLGYVWPELALLLGAGAVLLHGRAAREAAPTRGALLALVSLGVALVTSALDLRATPRHALPAVLFGGHLVADALASAFRTLFAALTFVVTVAGVPPKGARTTTRSGAENALLLVACLGMNLMAMARSLALAYLAAELVAVATVVLVALGRPRGGTGAALRALAYGAIASGVMLYGMSWLYGLSGSIFFPDIGERARTLTQDAGHLPNALALAAACVVAGLACRAVVAPFHPSASELCAASPARLGAFVALGPAAAGLALLVRFVREGLGVPALTAEPLAAWSVLLGSLAVLAMFVGNLAALAQRSLQRLLAFATVAQTGTMLLALAVLDVEGIRAMELALVTTCLAALGAFLVVAQVTDDAGEGTFAALRGLGAREPLQAASLAVFLASLVGLPPFAGFAAKVCVIAALLRAPGDYHAWYFLLVGAAALNVVLSGAYSVRVMRAMYFDEVPVPAPSTANTGSTANAGRVAGVVALVLVIPTLLLGVCWGPLYDFLCERVTP